MSGADARRSASKPLFARTFEVGCTVDLEQTNDSLHAYVELDGYEVGPGDEVVVLEPPTHVPFGERLTKRCRARVTQAGLFGRLWTPVAAYFELTELYEVGFDPRQDDTQDPKPADERNAS
nr:hypothetical protein [Methylopila turkensis]